MLTPSQILERIRAVREFQPSAIRSSILMAIVQFVSLFGAFILITLSIYVFSRAESLGHMLRKNHRFSAWLDRNEDLEPVFSISYSVYHAYFMLIIALLLLVVWKLTRMVRRRNAYILAINEIVDEKQED